MLALSACSSAGPRSSPAVLLPHVGEGYRLVAPSGPLSKQSLAAATALPDADVSSYLSRTHLRSAGERVWTSADGSFVTDVVATFGSAAEAGGLVTLAAKVVPRPGTPMFTPPGQPGARGFVQTSDVNGKTMFCVIEIASTGMRAFVLTRCTSYPQDTATVTQLLAQQLARA